MVFEQAGANPSALLEGKALDMEQKPYTKKSFDDFKSKLGCVDYSQDNRRWLFHYVELLLMASTRGGQDKAAAVVVSIARFLKKLAKDFNLEKNINGILIENGCIKKRAYRVSDLRKYPIYAGIIGYQDNKRFKPTKIIKFEITEWWIHGFIALQESPVLPKELEKLHKNTSFIIDGDRPIPQEMRDWLDKALYWKIKFFQPQTE